MDYYRLLEVRKDASPEVIEKAYKALCMKNHPDRQPPERQADSSRKMQRLNEAYSVLKDAGQRAVYDSQRRNHLMKLFWKDGLLGLLNEYL